MEKLKKINFFKRLGMFVANVQVNDMSSHEEKEMILSVCKEYGAEKEPIFTCGHCGKELTHVRPGKHQCDNEECLINQQANVIKSVCEHDGLIKKELKSVWIDGKEIYKAE